MKKVLIQGDLIQKHLSKISFPESSFNHPNCFEPTISHCNEELKNSVDELFLVIENQDNDQDSGVFITKLQKNDQENNISEDFWYRNISLLKKDADAENIFSECDFKYEDVKTKICGMKKIIQQEQSFLTKLNAEIENGNVTINI